MDDPVGVGDGVESEPVAAQFDGPADPAGEEGVVHRLGRVGGEDAETDARMTVVEAAAGPLAVAVDHVHDAAGRDTPAGFSTIFWKIHGMGRSSGDFEPDLRKRGGKGGDFGGSHVSGD